MEVGESKKKSVKNKITSSINDVNVAKGVVYRLLVYLREET